MRIRRSLVLSAIGLLAACHVFIDNPDNFSFVPTPSPDAGDAHDVGGADDARPKQGPTCCGPTCKVCPPTANAKPPACDEELGMCMIECEHDYIPLAADQPMCVERTPWERISLGNL